MKNFYYYIQLMRHNGFFSNDTEVLKLKNCHGYTVAHEQAFNGWTTENPEILKLTDAYSVTVKQTINRYKNRHKNR